MKMKSLLSVALTFFCSWDTKGKRKTEQVRERKRGRDPGWLHTIHADSVLQFSRPGRPPLPSVPVINLTFLAGVNLFQVFGL